MTPKYCIVQDEGHVRTVTLNRPEVLNALHADANDELATVWDEFAARDDLWVGIITGAGERAFSDAFAAWKIAPESAAAPTNR